MNTSGVSPLPSPEQMGVEAYVKALDLELKKFINSVYTDIRYGNSTFRKVEVEPGVEDLEEGSFLIYSAGGVTKLYTKIGNAMHSWAADLTMLTLAPDADAFLELSSSQVLSLDTQQANYGLMGPVVGDPAVPAFRLLVAGDLLPALGGAAALDVGVVEGTVAAGDDSRFLGDVHSQYARLAGRTAGQDLAGGVETAEEMVIRGTAHADNNGPVRLNPDGGPVVIGDKANPVDLFHVEGSACVTSLIVGNFEGGSPGYHAGLGFRSFFINFVDGVANQKADLYFPAWGGVLEIQITSRWAFAQNAFGTVGKTFLLGLGNGGVVFLNQSWCHVAQGNTSANFAISDCTWDAANNRWRVQFVHRVSTGNYINITIRAVCGSSVDADTFNNTFAVTSVYTTDATVFSTPVVNLPYNVGFRIDPTARVHLAAGTIAAGTAPLKLTSGALMTAPEVGAIEFLADKAYLTITTAAARKTFAFLEAPIFTGGITLAGTGMQTINRDGTNRSLLFCGGIAYTDGAYFQVTGNAYTSSPGLGSLDAVIRNNAGASEAQRSKFAISSYSGAAWTERFKIYGNTGDTIMVLGGGNVGIAVSSPTARLHLAAGTVVAGTAPLKFSSGPLNATRESGAVEFLTNAYYFNGSIDMLGSATIGIATGRATMSTWYTGNTAFWINMPTSGPSGIGSGGAGNQAWIAYVAIAGNWFTGSLVGDIVYRNTAGRLLLGNASTPTLVISNNNVGIGVLSPTACLHLVAGSTTAGTAPCKYTSGLLLSVSEIGADEFLTDKRYFTITTGVARKEYAFCDVALTLGRLPFVTTNGRLKDDATLLYDGSYFQSPGYKASDGSAGITGSQVVVVSVTQDPGTKDITVTSKTITYKSGLIAAVA